jgi:heme-degrading monooxygenase HmoA
MIIREWRARASPTKAEAYPAHFRANVVPELLSLSGFVGAHLASRQIGGRIEFVVLTRWTSMAAIREFAGRDTDKAVVEPAAVAALIDYDSTVQHYEVLEDVQSLPSPTPSG